MTCSRMTIEFPIDLEREAPMELRLETFACRPGGGECAGQFEFVSRGVLGSHGPLIILPGDAIQFLHPNEPPAPVHPIRDEIHQQHVGNGENE